MSSQKGLGFLLYIMLIYNDDKYLLQISSVIGHYGYIYSGTDPELSFFKNVLSYKASKFYDFTRKHLKDSDVQPK